VVVNAKYEVTEYLGSHSEVRKMDSNNEANLLPTDT
jgi:hypothetical protein